MNEIRLAFEAAENGDFRVHVTDARDDRSGVETALTPFLSEDDYEDLRWYLEEYMDLPDGGAVVRAFSVEDRLREWGHRLYDLVFPVGSNREFLTRLLSGPDPRVLTIATHNPALLRLPWELIADEAGSLAQRLSVRRQLDMPQAVEARKTRLPLRILYIVSRPDDTGFIDPRLTAKSLLAAVAPLDGSVRVDFCRPPTVARMEEMLREGEALGDPYDVVHFDGHGNFIPDAQIGALCFERADDGSGHVGTDFALADRLGDLLAKFRVPLAILEACRSGSVGRTLVFRSVAPRLIQAGVGSVLSMGHAVHVEGSRLLLDRFYRELVRGTTIGHAVAEGRSALRSTPARWLDFGPGARTVSLQDWFLPHLYQRGPDAPLLPPADAQQRVQKYDVFLSHNHSDAARVERLARALGEKHGLRVWLDTWETRPGELAPQRKRGIADSRFTVVSVSREALSSQWVAWEMARHNELNPNGGRLIPIRLEPVELPPDLDRLLSVDFSDPARDAESAALLARLIRSTDTEDALRRRGFRTPPGQGAPGAFPRPPQYGFHGRARELHELERRFRRHRGVVLHAMGGMGKTALATEAAHWWTQSGLFRDGACFVSFEQFTSAERVAQVLGGYCEGPRFDQLPAAEQRRRAVELLRERELVLVWDNYESALPQFNDGAAALGSPYTDAERRRLGDLFQDFTTGAGKGCILVTCRPGDTGLPGALRMERLGLARADSLWLLSRILDGNGLSLADPRLTRERLDPLLSDLGDHPLSLELVGPHLRTLTPEAIRKDFGALLQQFRQAAPEERNSSLLASLEFSRRHLGSAAREALPWLGLFSGGVFEQILLDVSGMEPGAWDAVRAELEGIALLRTESDLLLANRPFLRFHPTLALASADPSLAERPETRQRFVDAYLSLGVELYGTLRGSQSRSALDVLARDDANHRTAVRWAVADGRFREATSLGELLSHYLQRSGRLREHEAWVRELRDAVALGGFTAEAADYEWLHALTLYKQGDAQGAVDRLQALIERLARTTEFDPAAPLASATSALGRVLVGSSATAQSIPVLQQAVARWEALVEGAEGAPWQALLATPVDSKTSLLLTNLAITMGDLAGALEDSGQYGEALEIAENALAIQLKVGNLREVAANHGVCARILAVAGRLDEADARYDQALAAVREAGDAELEGVILQHQGVLASSRNQLERAGRLYRETLQRFQEAGNQAGMMKTYGFLGTIELKADRLAEARAWYGKARELALRLNDQGELGGAAQNIGILCLREGEVARERGDEAAARGHFEEGRRSVEESLRISRITGNRPDEGGALSLLAIASLVLGDLAAAERHAHEARQIYEPLGLPKTASIYGVLADIAEVRGDGASAAEWGRKRDELLDEQGRGGVGEAVSADLLRSLERLAGACARAGFGDGGIGPDEEGALALLEQSPAPFPDFAAWLRRLAARQLPPVPSTLPVELQQLLEDVAQTIRKALRS